MDRSLFDALLGFAFAAGGTISGGGTSMGGWLGTWTILVVVLFCARDIIMEAFPCRLRDEEDICLAACGRGLYYL